MSELAQMAQTIAVVLLVALAAVAVWRRLRAMARGEAQCGKCPGCGSLDSRCDEGAAGESGGVVPPAIARRRERGGAT
jgi:hypothetical protein